jgi:hypothetical protein
MSRKESIFTILRNNKIHFYKKIVFDIKSNYKNIIYNYDLFDNEGAIIKTVKHNSINKPADLLYYNNQLKNLEFWVHGKKHRMWGPAVISYDKKVVIHEEWYRNGIKLTDDEIDHVKKYMDRKRKIQQLRKRMEN